MLQQVQLRGRPSERGGRKFRPFSETGSATTHFKYVCNLFGKNAFASLAFAPARVVKTFAAASVTQPFQHFRFPLREMFIKPVLK